MGLKLNLQEYETRSLTTKPLSDVRLYCDKPLEYVTE